MTADRGPPDGLSAATRRELSRLSDDDTREFVRYLEAGTAEEETLRERLERRVPAEVVDLRSREAYSVVVLDDPTAQGTRRTVFDVRQVPRSGNSAPVRLTYLGPHREDEA